MDGQPSARSNQGTCQLGHLQVTCKEYEALKEQGFVSIDRRGKRHIYKLRFRYEGRQRVRYLGMCEKKAEAIRRELADLQQPHKSRLMIARLSNQACELMRRTKKDLAPLLEAAGYHYHGYEIRRTKIKKE